MNVYFSDTESLDAAPMPGFRNTADDIDLGRRFSSLDRHWFHILLGAVVVASIAVLIVWLATPKYKAEARILIETREPAFTRAGNKNPALHDEEMVSQVTNILSSYILARAATKLQLASTSDERVLEQIRQNLSVYLIEKSRVIAIEFRSPDQRLAAEMPNAIADEYIEARREEHYDVSSGARVLSRALAPSAPYFPKMLPMVGAVFAVSLLIIAIGIFLADLFSGRITRRTQRLRLEPGLTPAPLRTELESGHSMPLGPMAVKMPDGFGEIGVETAAERLISRRVRRAVFISPESDEAAASSVLVTRAVAEAGLRALLLDLSETGAAGAPMLESTRMPGITDLLAGQAQFTEVIHPDLYSGAHVMPAGNADRLIAMRAIDRLPIIVDALVSAYDMVIVECGAADIERVRRLVGDGTDIMISVLEPDDRVIRECASALDAAGYNEFTLVSPEGHEMTSPRVPGRTAA